MQTLQLTITLPDLVPFDDRAALQMQVLYVKSLVDAGTIDFKDPAQRDAVLEWYLKVVPHIQPTPEENEAAKAAYWKETGRPQPSPRRATEELMREIDAEMDRLEKENGWTAETYQQWASAHLRTPYQRP